MRMGHFIGIVPPEDHLQKIINFQRKWPANKIVNVSEPHITVKAQGGLTKDEKWSHKLNAVCRNVPSFSIQVGGPEFFGESVLFLSVDSADIHLLHHKLVDIIAPSNDLLDLYMEGDKFIPHLTLAQTHWGMEKGELHDMYKCADAVGHFSFHVKNLRVYHEYEANRYQKLRDIPLRV